ncbi:MAG TPA: molybdenum cofactor biosynthesis protein MoaE [Gemmatimonadaceae bacterium]|nr:molybdenum cofactor biosynthesis protein MoaE [Gemmatimonadaceae bacterium]
MRAAITSAPIDAPALLREVAQPANGAAVLFLGTVREQNEGRAVTGIDYAAYERMAELELEKIVREACDQFGTEHVVAEHRIGHLDVGEASVAIAAAHPHRARAFEAARWVIEEVKIRLPVWKREEYVDGTREWVGNHAGTPSYEAADSRFPIPDSR